MENNYMNDIKEIFNKGLKSGIYDIIDANKFLSAIKYMVLQDYSLFLFAFIWMWWFLTESDGFSTFSGFSYPH